MKEDSSSASPRPQVQDGEIVHEHPKFAHLETMEAETFKAMVLRCIYAFDREPLDKTRPFGMAAAALFICNGAAEANADTFRASLGGCTIKDRITGDWDIVVKRIKPATVSEGEGQDFSTSSTKRSE